MRDFTFDAYRIYLKTIQTEYASILTFDEYLHMLSKPNSFAMIRHDVDRKPLMALRMAKIENKIGIRSTYYFRTKAHVFKPSVIRAVRRLGHEIGYHYETLSDSDGDHEIALRKFELNLNRMRLLSRIETISMHGRPLSPYNNLDLWRNERAISKLHHKFSILGEIYLDINYKDIAYISDTGRNWEQIKSNKRDVVNTNVTVSLKSGTNLLEALKSKRWSKIVLQIHPERWSENCFQYFYQLINDNCINLVKKML